MKLNPKANQIRNLNFSEQRKEDIEMKQEMIDLLKTKTGYTKDIELSKGKRERRSKIRELSGNDPEKITSLKETLYTEEEKKDLDLCPFAQHKWYAELWKLLTPDQQKEMKENIKITADGKVEMIKMKKKFSQLTAQHNGKDIFDGSHVDQNWNTGIKGVTYLTGKAAEKEVKNQWKKLLKDRPEIEQIINFFPGENIKEKIFNFVKLFGLEKAGCWDPDSKGWHGVGSVGYVEMSSVDGDDGVYGIGWNGGGAGIGRDGQRFPSPFLAFEDC